MEENKTEEPTTDQPAEQPVEQPAVSKCIELHNFELMMQIVLAFSLILFMSVIIIFTVINGLFDATEKYFSCKKAIKDSKC